jgi:hypothetical protein
MNLIRFFNFVGALGERCETAVTERDCSLFSCVSGEFDRVFDCEFVHRWVSRARETMFWGAGEGREHFCLCVSHNTEKAVKSFMVGFRGREKNVDATIPICRSLKPKNVTFPLWLF